MQLYDTIGRGYADRRRPDPRIGAQILAALAGSSSVVNVGAGAGSYEPADRRLVAAEPSSVMIRQRGPDAAPVVRASATALPFEDASFDASLAILTIHHWPDLEAGLGELRRVSRGRVVLLTCDPSFDSFWLFDYLPELPEINHRVMPTLSELQRHLGPIEVTDVRIPHDCIDGFLCAYWRRPEEYLQADARAAISVFSMLRDAEPGLAALRRDLDSGQWQARHGELLARSEIDLGYRLVTTRST